MMASNFPIELAGHGVSFACRRDALGTVQLLNQGLETLLHSVNGKLQRGYEAWPELAKLSTDPYHNALKAATNTAQPKPNLTIAIVVNNDSYGYTSCQQL